MRARWRRLYVIAAMLTVTGFLFYRQGAKSGLHNSLQSAPSNVDSLKINGYQEEQAEAEEEEASRSSISSTRELSQPSVFQQWRDHQPLPLVQSTTEDCLQLKGQGAQQACLQRLRHVRQQCSRRQAEEAESEAFSDPREGGGGTGGTSINDSVVDVFSYQQGDRVVMYCSVHKVASTFWIRVFRYLHNDTSGGPVPSPEALSKYRVHLTPFKQARPFALAYITRTLQPEKQQFRFMFTRNPYHRLWAVYIDKFVLPDFFFWTYHASVIQDMVLAESESMKTRKPPSSCFDVTFETFVLYTVQDELSSFAHSDDHILPVTRVCNPCAFQPHFIGYLENMTADSHAVLDRLNLSHVVTPKDFQERALNHMQTITDFVHDTVVEREGLRHCVSDKDLQARLIRAFILSGFLPPDAVDIGRTSVVSSSRQLFSMVRELFLHADRDEQEVEAQRRRFMINAYESLPWDLLLQVRDYYKEDFHMFGYDPEPAELFVQREERERSAVLTVER